MNWQKIIKECPKAHIRLIGESGNNQNYVCMAGVPWYDMDDFPFTIRELYEFFDENRLFIEICVGSSVEYDPCFYAFINGKEQTTDYETRLEAEEDAFEVAFHLLEAKLTKQPNSNGPYPLPQTARKLFDPANGKDTR